MSTHRSIDKICCAAMALALLLTLVLMNGSALGIQAADTVMGYEDRLFDTSAVHTIDIQMDDWEGFLAGCTDEEYVLCDLVIDGESFSNVAIRAKGNTSLTQVASYGNDRYSFKVEFDHYDGSISYHGLDKLSLNNIIQDNTYMKDYLTYQMMGYFGVNAPLCSYAYLTVNGEDWGLYLAVEGVEESFLERNYGGGYSELYKPDSMSMGGGRGNGGFDLADWMADREDGGTEDAFDPETFFQEMEDMGFPGMDGGMPESPGDGTFAGAPEMPDGEVPEAAEAAPEGGASGDVTAGDQSAGTPEDAGDAEGQTREDTGKSDGRQFGGMGGGMMGSDDVSLVYTDDDYDSYANIFDNAKTDITDADKDRLIAALKQLNKGTDIEAVVDVDQVIRYFVVHNFVCNFDSYTGSMIHNYYLYEEDGLLSMIPWDYNLAFGGFQGGGDATSMVNYPINTPVSGGTVESRPMLAWIFADEEYTALYHQYFSEFIAQYFESGYFEQMMAETKALIAPYVEQDPTKFCTYEEFETGIDTLERFCLLRAQSVRGQLEGTIPSTDEGQTEDGSALVDASSITISDMGSMNNGGMGGGIGIRDRGQTGEGDLSASTGAPAEQEGSQPDAGEPSAGSPQGADDAADEASAMPEQQTAPNDVPSPDAAGGGQPSAASGGAIQPDRLADRNSAMTFPGNAAVSRTTSTNTLLLLGASAVVLLIGLLIAALYRKRA